MKAIRTHARGGPAGLVYEEAPTPALGPGEALVRVHAAGITPTELSWPTTYTTRDGADRLPVVPCHEVSGVVEAVTADVAVARTGEAVYGLTDFWKDGAAAEFVAVRAEDLAPKPRSLDYVQAAAVPLSALSAWQALFVYARLEPGARALIQGAAGAVGTYAVQLAKWRGAYVLATASARHTALLRELGADEVIDYTQVRFEEVAQAVDAVLDLVGGDTQERSWGVLRPGGILVTLVGGIDEVKAAAHRAKGASFIVEPSRAQLVEIGDLIDAGRVRPIIEAVLPLTEARAAFERGLQGHDQGKIVLQVIK